PPLTPPSLHSFPTRRSSDLLAAFLYAGVTTVLDLGSLSPAVFQERERLATGARLGPHLYAAGPIFTAPGGHPAEVLRAWLPWYLDRKSTRLNSSHRTISYAV